MRKSRPDGWRQLASEKWRAALGKLKLSRRLAQLKPQGGKQGKAGLAKKKKKKKKPSQLKKAKLKDQAKQPLKDAAKQALKDKVKQQALKEAAQAQAEAEAKGPLVGKAVRLVEDSAWSPGKSLLVNTSWRVARQRPDEVMLQDGKQDRWHKITDIYCLTGAELLPMPADIPDYRKVVKADKEAALRACGNELKPVSSYSMLESPELMALWEEVLWRAKSAGRPAEALSQILLLNPGAVQVSLMEAESGGDLLEAHVLACLSVCLINYLFDCLFVCLLFVLMD